VTSAPRRYRFGRGSRLSKARQFEQVRKEGVRRSAGAISVICRPNGTPRHRLGLSVGRPVGSAVERNRAKRIIREAYRLVRHDLPAGASGAYDIVVSVRAGAAVKLADVRRDLPRLVEACHREWAPRRRDE
jgi:ribonuclease P protein component